MAELTQSAKQGRFLLGNGIWGVITLDDLKPCREPVQSNAATDFVLECVCQALLRIPRSQIPEGFLSLAGSSQFARTQFPDEILSIIENHAEAAVQELVSTRQRTVSFGGDQYRILLAIHANRATARQWIKEQNWLQQDPQRTSESKTVGAGTAITVALSELLPDYEAAYLQLKSFRREAHLAMARRFEPVLLQQAALMPADSYANKQEIATWVNAQLRELGLAIECPKTGLPAILGADLRDAATQSSRFRIIVRDENGRQTKTLSSKELPQFQLMVDTPRQESRAKKLEPGHSLLK